MTIFMTLWVLYTKILAAEVPTGMPRFIFQTDEEPLGVQTKQSEAMQVCLGWEKAAKAGKAKTLTEGQVRKVLSDILEGVTGEKILHYTCSSWFTESLQNRAGSATAATMLRYKQVTRDYPLFLKDRADLPLAAIHQRIFARSGINCEVRDEPSLP